MLYEVITLEIAGNMTWAVALAIGALIANLFSIVLVFIESARVREEY